MLDRSYLDTGLASYSGARESESSGSHMIIVYTVLLSHEIIGGGEGRHAKF